MKPGIHYGLPNDDYHAADGISKSGLDRIRHSPLYYKIAPDVETDSKRLGSAAHGAILEFDQFAVRYALGPDCHRNTKRWHEAQAQTPGRELLKPAEWREVMSMRNAIFTRPELRELRGKAEVSVFAKHREYGLLCKCRPDFLSDDGILYDLKTTSDITPGAISRTTYQFRYHVQQAWYTDVCKWAGIKIKGFRFIFVEKQTHDVVIVKLKTLAVDMGRAEYERDLHTYRYCLKNDVWPGVCAGVAEIDLPMWAYSNTGETDL